MEDADQEVVDVGALAHLMQKVERNEVTLGVLCTLNLVAQKVRLSWLLWCEPTVRVDFSVPPNCEAPRIASFLIVAVVSRFLQGAYPLSHWQLLLVGHL